MSDEQQLGELVEGWKIPARPEAPILDGFYSRLELLDADTHAEELHRVYSEDDRIWDFLPYGPFASAADYHRWVVEITAGNDPVFYAIKNLETDRFEGVASYLRINPEMGSIEVGHINFSVALQRTRAATDAMYQMMKWAYTAGYRRYEWKCNALNMGSRRAAERLGFSYEGIFRQAGISKGRNRDTAWYASIDKEWPPLRAAFGRWLNSDNFDDEGQQRESLADLTHLIRVVDDPVL